MPKYENSVIYKLKHNEDYDDTNIYVGSTSNFKNRKYKHKNNCNNEKLKEFKFPVYQYIRDNGNWDEWVMTPIEQYPCNSKKELLIRERHYIDILRPTLNIVKPGRTKKEHYEDNKEQILEKFKEYNEANKEKIQEYLKQYHIDNKEKIIERSKKYYQNNKKKVKEYNKIYFSENAICDHCGCEVRKANLNIHKKSKKCINFVKKD